MIRSIVVPVDFSDLSCRAASYAVRELAPILGASVVFVTVLETSDLRVAMTAGLHGFADDADLHHKVEAWIEEQFSKVESAEGAVKAQRDVRRGIVEREILEAIKEHHADLVVMGSAGIAKRLPVGSKTDYVLKHSTVPLLVIRH